MKVRNANLEVFKNVKLKNRCELWLRNFNLAVRNVNFEELKYVKLKNKMLTWNCKFKNCTIEGKKCFKKTTNNMFGSC